MANSEKTKTVIILGSSRDTGNTSNIVNELIKITNWDSINLNDYSISNYDYEHSNINDDFINLMSRLTINYDILIFATPVYWYSMSGVMKVFLDRFTDLITVKKDVGRKLKGKCIAVISSSNGDNLDSLFWIPFKKTAEYLGMNYLADLHTIQGKTNKVDLSNFKSIIEKTYQSVS